MDHVIIQQLTFDRARQNAAGLVDLIRSMSEIQYWDEANLLSERPMKWDISIWAIDQHAGVPVGLLIASMKEPTVAHIHKQAVHPSFRGQGIGKRMFESFRSQVKTKFPQLERITLNIYADNVRGIRFNEANGFEYISDRETPLGRLALMQYLIR